MNKRLLTALQLLIFNIGIAHADHKVGDIIASALPEAEFITLHGSDWVLADGRACPDGAKYCYDQGGNNTRKIPDLRGAFLRGADARSGANKRDLLTSQDWATGRPKTMFNIDDIDTRHTHSGSVPYWSGGSDSGSPGLSPRHTGTHHVTLGFTTSVAGQVLKFTINGGDTETRPYNIAVNFFIKIDDKNPDVDNVHARVVSIENKIKFNPNSDCEYDRTTKAGTDSTFICLKNKIEAWETGINYYNAPQAMAMVKKITRLRHESLQHLDQSQLSFINTMVDNYPTFIYRK